MAVVYFIKSPKMQTRAGTAFILSYCGRDEKTVYDGKKYVSGVRCVASSAYHEFMNTKKLYGKEDGRMFYHLFQSFGKDEAVTPQIAHEIALKLAEEFKGFEILVGTHCDREHIHSHFIINSVSCEDGKKFHCDRNFISRLRQRSDELCREYGLTVIDPKPKKTQSVSGREYHSASKGQSWKLKLALVIDETMRRAVSREHFIELMELESYQVKWTDERKYITYTTPDGFKCRDNKLHEEKYLKGNMEDEFRIRCQIFQLEKAGSATDTDRRKSRADCSRNRNKLESDDWFTENANRDAGRDDADIGNTDNQRRTGTVYERSAQHINPEQYRLSGSGDGISDRDEESRGGIYRIKSNGDIGYRETGWENERELLEQSFNGERTDKAFGEETVLDQYDPFGDESPVLADTAYLAAYLTDIIENEHPIEDCTTMKQPRQKKKKEQNHGPVMGGM